MNETERVLLAQLLAAKEDIQRRKAADAHRERVSEGWGIAVLTWYVSAASLYGAWHHRWHQVMNDTLGVLLLWLAPGVIFGAYVLARVWWQRRKVKR